MLFGFATAFGIVLLAMPALIKVAKIKHLVDEPSEERKLHHSSIPTIGGILIFAGTIVAYCLWFPSGDATAIGTNYNVLSALDEFKYLVACLFILFFLGLKDDITGVSPLKKLGIHLIVAFIMVVQADIRITQFWGLFGLNEIPYWLSVSFTVFVYIVIVNAINLIDGVDGLAGGVGLISSMGFAYWFYLTGDAPLALLAMALGGSLLGFLVFNFNPARIFMGDSGSLLIGAVLCVLAIKLIEFPKDRMPEVVEGVSKPVVAMALLAYPLVDTLRIFTYRALKGRSPFSADRNHIHHKLMRMGLGHKRTVIVVYLYTLFMILLTVFMPKESPNVSFLIVGAAAVLAPVVLFLMKDKQAA